MLFIPFPEKAPSNASVSQPHLPSSPSAMAEPQSRRELIGTVTLHVGDGETAHSFLDDVETRIRNNSKISSAEVTQLVQDVLRPAALDAIHEREGRGPSMNATQTYPVFVVYIRRSRAGRILTEPTSFPQ